MPEYDKPTEADLLFPEHSFDYQGLTVVVKALPARKVLKLATLFQTLRRFTGSATAESHGADDRSTIAELLLSIRADTVRLLEESVEIRGADLGMLDLPFYLFPQLLELFLEVNFDLGNWSALGRTLGIEAPVSGLIESLTFGLRWHVGQRS